MYLPNNSRKLSMSKLDQAMLLLHLDMVGSSYRQAMGNKRSKEPDKGISAAKDH